jgi:hypothetical protein
MGSALCFPIEEVVFLTVVFLGLQRAYRTRFTKLSHIKRYLGSVRIYGDDIIVPTDAVDAVRSTLRLFGFKVNTNKSFWTGKFRESCGKEYFDGEDVTIVRLRRQLPSSQRETDQMVSLVAFRNNAYRHGLWKTAGWIDSYISEMIPFPVVGETSPVLGRVSCLGIPDYPLDKNLHTPMVKGMIVRHRLRKSIIDGEAALMKSLTVGLHSSYPDESSLVSEDGMPPRSWWNPVTTEANHLEFAGRPISSALIYRRGPAGYNL